MSLLIIYLAPSGNKDLFPLGVEVLFYFFNTGIILFFKRSL